MVANEFEFPKAKKALYPVHRHTTITSQIDCVSFKWKNEFDCHNKEVFHLIKRETYSDKSWRFSKEDKFLPEKERAEEGCVVCEEEMLEDETQAKVKERY
jgi:hypothetical protein